MFNYGWFFHESGAWYSRGRGLATNCMIIYDTDGSTKIIVLSNLLTENRGAEALESLIAEELIGTLVS